MVGKMVLGSPGGGWWVGDGGAGKWCKVVQGGAGWCREVVLVLVAGGASTVVPVEIFTSSASSWVVTFHPLPLQPSPAGDTGDTASNSQASPF